MTRIDLLQGTLDLLVLRTLEHEARHGYQIARAIKRLSSEVLQVEEGALYPALHRLKSRGWIRGEWGLSENNRRAKFYSLTGGGEKQLRKGARAWARYADAVSKVLGSPKTGEPLAVPVPETLT